MMQGISVSSLVIPANNVTYRLVASWRSDIKVVTDKTHLNSGILRQGLRWSFPKSKTRRRELKTRAAWLFNGNDKGMEANSERSESANEDILIFFFQLDLATRVQCALNMEQYEIAQQLRNKLTEVEVEVIKQREAKRGSTSSKNEAQDKAINILHLRRNHGCGFSPFAMRTRAALKSNPVYKKKTKERRREHELEVESWRRKIGADMQKAIESENYALAAELRDQISKLEAESLAASAKALAYEKTEYAFRLGQKVRHKMFGYRAVVCGMDPICCESSSWMETAHVEKLQRGSNQPFYQVLVDVRADPNLLVAYVPEENLLAMDQPDMDRLDHPYISFLFYGMDSAGDFIPIKQLREKYNRARHEVPFDPHGEEED